MREGGPSEASDITITREIDCPFHHLVINLSPLFSFAVELGPIMERSARLDAHDFLLGSLTRTLRQAATISVLQRPSLRYSPRALRS